MSGRMRNLVTASLLAAALAFAGGRAFAQAPASPASGSIVRPAELARVRCLLVAPFENGSDAPQAAEAVTTALVSAVDPERTRVFPVAELRGLFRDTPLELPQGISPSLALELAELVGADGVLWGSVEGRSRDASPELLVTVRLGSVGDRRLLFAESRLAKPAAGERPETAARRAALDLARPLLAGLGDPGRKQCFDPERSRTVRRLAVAEEGPARATPTPLPHPAPAKEPGVQAAPPPAPARAQATAQRPAAARAEPRTPRQKAWAERLGAGERVLVDDVSFAGRSAALQRDAGLTDLAVAILSRPGLGVRVEGFVDATNDRGGDQKLSAAMAQAAGKRLAELGVPKQLLTIAGRGGDNPVLPNFTGRGRAANRRIEVVGSP